MSNENEVALNQGPRHADGVGSNPELRAQRRRELLETQICYRGFAYNVRSQWGIDSLRRAIKENGHG